MIRRLIAAFACASSCVAADVAVMHDGSEIVGKVISSNVKGVVFEVSGIRQVILWKNTKTIRRGVEIATIERSESSQSGSSSRVKAAGPAVTKGSVTSTSLAGQPLASQSIEAAWIADAGLSVGLVKGSIKRSGDIRTVANGASSPVSSSDELNGFGALPGGWLRLSWQRYARGSSLLLGVQGAYGGVKQSVVSYSQSSLAGLGGWAWDQSCSRMTVWVDVGPAKAKDFRSLTLSNGESVDNSSNLNGWTTGLGGQVEWRRGDCRFGLGAGLDYNRLTGTSSWQTSTVVATEDITASLVYVHANVSIGWSF